MTDGSQGWESGPERTLKKLTFTPTPPLALSSPACMIHLSHNTGLKATTLKDRTMTTTTTLTDDQILAFNLCTMEDAEVYAMLPCIMVTIGHSAKAWAACELEVEQDVLQGHTIVRDKRTVRLCWKSSCNRCCGAGGHKHWPGFTCFRCGGINPREHEQESVSMTGGIRKMQERVKNDRAGKGRFTNLELKHQAKANAELAKRDAAVTAAGIDPKRYWDASQLVGLWGRDTIYINEDGNPWAREVANPDYNQKRYRSLCKLDIIATSIVNKAAKFDLSEKQVTLVNEYIEQVENIEQVEADRAAETKAIEVLEGRVVITGTIFWSREYDGDWGTTVKIGVKADNGAVYFGTKPSGAYGAENGDTITFTATSTKTEPGKGKFSRPAKASYTANTEEGEANA